MALRSLLAGAVGGLVVSALGLGAGYSFLTSKADGPTPKIDWALSKRKRARRTPRSAPRPIARARRSLALEKRIGALEASAGASNTADLDKRVAALEAASAGNGASSDATQRLAAQAKDLRADVDAEKGADS